MVCVDVVAMLRPFLSSMALGGALLLVSGCAATEADPSWDEPEIAVPKREEKAGDGKNECAPKSCADLAVSCGSYDDGCGGQTDCGSCDPSCQPKTCADLGKTCGKHDNGCGGLVDCGTCAPGCQPKTCAQLGKTCGSHDDGCGGVASCGVCSTSTCTDAKEANDSWQTARDLGASTDSPATSLAVYSLTLPDGDEDWFKTQVTDGGFNGNPRITVSVARPVEVSAFYKCNNGGDASYCPNTADTADNTVGSGCRGRASVALKTSCSGLTDSGTAYIRVRKLSNDGQCGGYSLDVRVDN